MKRTALIVARMGSNRLPGKVLRPVFGKPLLERLIERVRLSRLLDQLVITTTDQTQDDPLAQLARQIGVDCFRGPAQDVLGRLQLAAAQNPSDLFVELLGDNPLVHGALIDDVIRFHEEGNYDYAATVTSEYPHAPEHLHRFPIGIRVQTMTPKALAHCARLAQDPLDREHATRWIIHHPRQFRIGYFEATNSWASLHRPEWTLAVNHAQNLEMIQGIFERCGLENPGFSISEALETLKVTPSLVTLMGTPRD